MQHQWESVRGSSYQRHGRGQKGRVSVETAYEEPRFRMLATIREYGLELLAGRGDEEELRRRHADFYLSMSEARLLHCSPPDS